MPSTTRRYLLRMGCLTAMGSVAGCKEITQEESEETRLTFLLFHNSTDAAQSVAVRIENETEMLDESITVEPHSTDFIPPDSVRSEGYPTDPGSYEVVFELQTRTDEGGRATFDLGSVDEECIGYTVEIRPGQSKDAPQMNVFTNNACDEGRMGNATN